MTRILVVDNDFSNADAIQMVLENLEYVVKSINQPELLKDTIEKFMPDLIIMDILLGNSDGRVLCDLIKADSKTAHIPVMLITAMMRSQANAITCQADSLMLKPFDFLKFAEEVHTLIHGKL
ncbi:response regulator [Pedobacter rhodius]|uniref:Response regulator n=1 Tax=Pedobacter rhodius TaxID=3004098 RepID=A0ABT4KZI6_9SPHI|nr:response regulator [Pedobacter sp. SJ11]MCZ4223258.1 response regulator [Pedobacter sp. SJ11]